MLFPAKIISNLIGACWLVFLIYWIIRAPGNKKSLKIERNSGLREALQRTALVIVGLFAAFIALKYFPDIAVIHHSKLTQSLGVALCAFGIGWAIWARNILGTNWSANPTIKENHELVQTGPYKITRHPIYTGMIFAFLGTFLAIIPTWMGFGFLSFGIIGIYLKLAKEEQLMMQTFPEDYITYKKRVKSALVPYIF